MQTSILSAPQTQQSKVVELTSQRRFHSYCLGAAKTGTTSVAKAFSGAYRAEHEPDLSRTFQLIRQLRKHQLDDIAEQLVARDKDLNLEMEASHPSIFFVPYLVALFPQAKFIITVREPKSWLSSRLDFHYKKRTPEFAAPLASIKRRALYSARPLKHQMLQMLRLSKGMQGSWRDYNDMLAETCEGPYGDEDLFLRELGISSLETYLREYANHYRMAMTIPHERRLIVNLRDLDNRMAEIAQFVGADPHKVLPSAENVNRGNTRPKLIEQLPTRYVANKLTLHCGWMVDKGLVEQDW